jgi:hypothetical protein
MALSDLEHTIHILKVNLVKGWTYFHIAKEVKFKQLDTGNTNALYFFVGVKEACLDYSILIFNKIAGDNQSKISFRRLLNEVEQNLGEFTFANEEDVKATLDSHNQKLIELQPFIKEVKHWRGNVIAHTSLEFVRKPSEMNQFPPLNLGRLEESYKDFFKMINAYSFFLGADTISLDEISKHIQEDFGFLRYLIKKADEEL